MNKTKKCVESIDNRIGNFKLYDRVKIKGKNLTGHIVEIMSPLDCIVEFDEECMHYNDMGILEVHIDELEEVKERN